MTRQKEIHTATELESRTQLRNPGWPARPIGRRRNERSARGRTERSRLRVPGHSYGNRLVVAGDPRRKSDIRDNPRSGSRPRCVDSRASIRRKARKLGVKDGRVGADDDQAFVCAAIFQAQNASNRREVERVRGQPPDAFSRVRNDTAVPQHTTGNRNPEGKPVQFDNSS